ncbi:MAG: GNAT family N-acetyltransferase [Chloroflexi bacterium]|nr:GNAT family N-acetyltransferase [Chloroflexota bacterium]
MDQQIGFQINEWSPSIYPTKTDIKGKYCEVIPLNINNHAEQLFNAFKINKDGSNWTYLSSNPFNEFEEFHAWLKSDCSGKDPIYYSIIDTKNSEAIGMASHLRIEPSIGVIEVGNIHFSPKLQKTRIATESMYLMMKRVFEEWGYRRYEWKCDNYNNPSKKAAIRLGFTFEGIFRQATIYKNRNRDTAWFSIIDTEWPVIKKKFENWLLPSNFDADGIQIKKLQ